MDFATLEGSVGSEDDSSSVLDITNERNTVGIFGDGLVELLAREITYDLLQIVDDAREYAEENNMSVRKELKSKGINFGYITIKMIWKIGKCSYTCRCFISFIFYYIFD